MDCWGAHQKNTQHSIDPVIRFYIPIELEKIILT